MSLGEIDTKTYRENKRNKEAEVSFDASSPKGEPNPIRSMAQSLKSSFSTRSTASSDHTSPMDNLTLNKLLWDNDDQQDEDFSPTGSRIRRNGLTEGSDIGDTMSPRRYQNLKGSFTKQNLRGSLTKMKENFGSLTNLKDNPSWNNLAERAGQLGELIHERLGDDPSNHVSNATSSAMHMSGHSTLTPQASNVNDEVPAV